LSINKVLQWKAAQEEAERLAALHDSIGQTYALGVHEEWWNARSKKLEADLKAACARRDGLTAGVCGEITATKTRIFRRCSAFGGKFGSWAWIVAQELPDSTMARELLAARKRVDDSRSIAEIVDIASHWANQIESTPNSILCGFTHWQTSRWSELRLTVKRTKSLNVR
jgi:hypothetical protein